MLSLFLVGIAVVPARLNVSALSPLASHVQRVPRVIPRVIETGRLSAHTSSDHVWLAGWLCRPPKR